MPRTSQVRRIIVKAETSGARQLDRLSKKMSSINKTTKRMESGFSRLGNTFRGFIAAVGVREVARAADTFQLLEDRIKVFTGDSESAAAAMKDLQSAAKLTKTSISALATSYARIALATQELGLSQDQILATTVALQQSFRIGGATIAEATAATIQLSQGLASGQLRGQELRSVLEANTVFAGLLAEELNTTRGNLIKFAESGRITSDVVLTALQKNFEKLNEDASVLGTTFEQSFIIVLDAARFQLKELNKEFKLSEKFASLSLWLIDNFKTLFTVISAFVGSKVLATFGVQLFNAVSAISAAGSIFSISTIAKINLFAGAVAAAVLGFRELGKSIGEDVQAQRDATPILKKISMLEDGVTRLRKKMLEDVRLLEESGGWINRTFKPDQIAESAKAINKSLEEIESLKGLFDKGLDVVPSKEIEKEKDLFTKLREEYAKFKAVIEKTAKVIKPGPYKALNDQLKASPAFLNQYNAAIEKIRIDELNEKFKQGKIINDEYADGLLKIKLASKNLSNLESISVGIKAGAKSYLDTVGTLAQEISKAVNATFQRLEDNIFDFIKTGKFAFKEFTQAILDDLTRIAIRKAIVAPLANAAFGSVGSANGNVFQGGNVVPFAYGGILSGPTVFPLSGGRTGVAGEAGPEGILPLSRGKSGRLGVDASGMGVVVNVVNNSTDTEVQTTETTNAGGERQIDVMIVNKVGRAFGEGKFDRTFKELYGINRRGR